MLVLGDNAAAVLCDSVVISKDLGLSSPQKNASLGQMERWLTRTNMLQTQKKCNRKTIIEVMQNMKKGLANFRNVAIKSLERGSGPIGLVCPSGQVPLEAWWSSAIWSQ